MRMLIYPLYIHKTIQSLKQPYWMVMLLSYFTENETEAQRGCLIYCRYLEEKNQLKCEK